MQFCGSPIKSKQCYSEENNTLFHNVLEGLANQLQPSVTQLCTMMLVLNLAQPDWMSVDCELPLLSHVVCFSAKNNTAHRTVSHENNQPNCRQVEILYLGLCYHLVWIVAHTTSIVDTSPGVDIESRTTVFHHILNSTGVKSLNFVTTLPSFVVGYFTISKGWTQVQTEKSVTNAGFLACVGDGNTTAESNILFLCMNGSYVSTIHFCNSILHCIKKIPFLWSKSLHRSCSESGPTRNKSNVCHPLLYKSTQGSCNSFTAKRMKTTTVLKKSLQFKCGNQKSLPVEQVNDLISDCDPDDEDEVFLRNVVKGMYFSQCSNPNQLPCLPGHPLCYNITDICVYRVESAGLLKPCRTGSHIQHCQTFECHALWKCPGSYCIPWACRCDGKRDCPGGNDEQDCSSNLWNCHKKFKCYGSNVCLAVSNVCDTHVDCPHKDDEVMCDLNKNICSRGCSCLNYAIVCHNVTVQALHVSYVSYHVTHCNLSILNNMFSETVIELNFSSNSILQLCTLNKLRQLRSIDVSKNNISLLQTSTFLNTETLSFIRLRENKMLHVEPKCFVDMIGIHLLDLEKNELTYFLESIFHNVSKIALVNLRQNQLLTFEENMSIPTQIILVDEFAFCCEKSKVEICSSPKFWFSSCSGVLPSKALKIMFPFTASLIFALNVITAVVNVLNINKTKKQKGTHKKSQKHGEVISFGVCLSSLFMGSYLLIVGLAHSQFSLPLHLNSWKASVLCILAFFSETFHNSMQLILLPFLSIARHQVVAHPFDSSFKSFRFVLFCVTLIAFGTMLLAGVVTFLVFFFQRNSDQLCVLSLDVMKAHLEVFISLLCAALVQCLALAIILISGVLLIRALKKSQAKAGRAGVISHGISAQIAVLFVAPCISWLVPSTVFVSVYVSAEYSLEIPPYTLTIAMPVNAVAIPVVFLALQTKQ